MQIAPVVTSQQELSLNSLYDPSLTSGWAADMMQGPFAFLVLRAGRPRTTSTYM